MDDTGYSKLSKGKTQIILQIFNTKGDNISLQKYKKHQNRLTRDIEQAQDYHYNNEFEACSGDPKITWSKLNQILHKRKVKSKLPQCLKDNDGLTNEPKVIVNKLNTHFVQKGIKLAASLPPSNKSILENMMPRVAESISNIKFDTKEVVECINDLNINKAAGHDNIQSKIIKWSITIKNL